MLKKTAGVCEEIVNKFHSRRLPSRTGGSPRPQQRSSPGRHGRPGLLRSAG